MKKPIEIPTFANEAEETDWWASREGREFVKQQASEPTKKGCWCTKVFVEKREEPDPARW